MKKNNIFFIISGVLAILAAVSEAVLSFLCLAVSFVFMAQGTYEASDGTTIEGSQLASVLFVYFFILLLLLAVSIFLAVVFLKNRSLTYEQLHAKSGLFITAIVLSFLFGGILMGVLALIGFSSKWESVQVEANAEPIDVKLKKLQGMLERGEITQEEYDRMRKNILDRF